MGNDWNARCYSTWEDVIHWLGDEEVDQPVIYDVEPDVLLQDSDHNWWSLAGFHSNPTKLEFDQQFQVVTRSFGLDEYGDVWNLEGHPNRIEFPSPIVKFVQTFDRYGGNSIALDEQGVVYEANRDRLPEIEFYSFNMIL